MGEQLSEQLSEQALNQGLFELQLVSTDARSYRLSDWLGGRATVVIFFGNGCPTARSYEDRLKNLVQSHEQEGLGLVAVNANNPALSPPDTLEEMAKRARQNGFNFPYLKDSDGLLAQGFGAVCTPHAFLLDADRKVVYSGRIDDSRLGDRITTRDLERAIREVLTGKPVTVSHTEPFGCSIVW